MGDAVSIIERLTPRERQVFNHVIHGDQSKTIAHLLGIALGTVEIHRANIRRKLGPKNPIQLRALAEAEGIAPTPGPCK